MRNVRVTYFGSGTLSLQMRRFPSNQQIVCRLDDILPPEWKKNYDTLLVTEMDGRLMNAGGLVPQEKVIEAAKNNPKISKEVVHIAIPKGFYIKEVAEGSRLVPEEKEEVKPVAMEPPKEEKKEEKPAEEPKEEKRRKKNKKMDDLIEEI